MRVLVVGPGLDVQGGVSQVIRLTLEYPPPNTELDFIPTLTQRYAAAHLARTTPAYWRRAFGNGLFFLRSLRAIQRRANQVDLVHIHVSVAGSTLRKMLVAQRLQRQGTPYILHNHGADYDIFFTRLARPLQRRVVQMFKAARGTIVLSNWWYEQHRKLLNLSDTPLWVMPNPIEIPSQASERAIDSAPPLKLLYLGRMDERKGSARVLHALAALPPLLRTQIHLKMAGDGEVEAMRRLACELGLEHCVEIRGWIEREEKLRWMEETNAFILPSRAEGLPMSLLEAMAWGKAVIVSAVGGIPEFVHDRQEGIIVPPNDIQAIAEAIRCLAESPALRVQMGQAARAQVAPLDIRHYRVRLGEIYCEALKSGSSRG